MRVITTSLPAWVVLNIGIMLQTVVTQPNYVYNIKGLKTLAENKLKTEFDNTVSNNFLKNDEFLSPKSPGERRSARHTQLTTAIGKQSNDNLREYQRLTGLGLPRVWTLAILRGRRHPSCFKPVVACFPNNKYRSIDGVCNNYIRPLWGSSNREFRRLFPAQYSDGFNRQKGLAPQAALPNARLVSSTIHSDLIKPDEHFTNMVPQIGQFLDHDFALTTEDDLKCCSEDKNHRDCWPIQIPAEDAFYANVSQTCMSFTRSTPYCFPTDSGVREQFNIDTSYIDASNVYGSNNERTRQLREFNEGRLAVNLKNSRLLPTVQQIKEKYNTEIDFMGKYLAGDDRVNEMPALAVLHTLWVHEHNRIAGLISTAKPSLNDEAIFQEARRIVIAEWQNVIYGQFLPTVLGNNTMLKYNLYLGSDITFTDYNSNLDATLFHYFSTAAYRFGHTLLNGLIRLVKGLTEVGSYRVRDNYFQSEEIEMERNGSSGYDLILGGLMTQNAQAPDRHVSVDFTNFLFKEKMEKFGADLIARNIQRSRDHAIPNYGTYRTYCGLNPLTNWQRKPSEILEETWQKLKSVYKNPQDIELFPGGLSEIPVPGAASGSTFNCLKAMQFRNLKFGDRFFFTHRNQAGSFTSRQLQTIRRRTLGDVICDNSNIERTTVNVFRIASDSNPFLDCNDLRRTKITIRDFV